MNWHMKRHKEITPNQNIPLHKVLDLVFNLILYAEPSKRSGTECGSKKSTPILGEIKFILLTEVQSRPYATPNRPRTPQNRPHASQNRPHCHSSLKVQQSKYHFYFAHGGYKRMIKTTRTVATHKSE